MLFTDPSSIVVTRVYCFISRVVVDERQVHIVNHVRPSIHSQSVVELFKVMQ